MPLEHQTRCGERKEGACVFSMAVYIVLLFITGSDHLALLLSTVAFSQDNMFIKVRITPQSVLEI